MSEKLYKSNKFFDRATFAWSWVRIIPENPNFPHQQQWKVSLRNTYEWMREILRYILSQNIVNSKPNDIDLIVHQISAAKDHYIAMINICLMQGHYIRQSKKRRLGPLSMYRISQPTKQWQVYNLI